MTSLRILHLSDTHLMSGDQRHQGVVDTVGALRTTLSSLEAIEDIDLVVLSGDVSDDGAPQSYETLAQLVGDFASAHGAPVVYAMGNHDQRDGFQQILGNGHPGQNQDAAALALGSSGGPLLGSTEVKGFRVITLDSSVPEHTHGYLDPGQLDWLRAQLRQPAPNGSIVVVHHPPVPPLTALHHGIELQNPSDLVDALPASEVVAILSGHYHHSLVDALDIDGVPVPVVVAGGVVNSNDVLAGAGHERATSGGNATLITIHSASGPRSTPTVRVVPLHIPLPESISPEEVFDLDAQAVAAISASISAPGYVPDTIPNTVSGTTA